MAPPADDAAQNDGSFTTLTFYFCHVVASSKVSQCNELNVQVYFQMDEGD